MNKKELGIYLHIPFCVRKCGYCDFLSFPADARTRTDYVDRLCREIRGAGRLYRELADPADPRPDFAGSVDPDKTVRAGTRNSIAFPDTYEVVSIFLGGGTPSVLSADQVDAILSAVRETFCVSDRAEVTMECNPGTQVDYAALREAGVNRISLGMQSASDDELRTLGRIHRRDDVIRTVEKVRAAGIGNLNLDLMFSLPGQTTEGWEETLRIAAGLGPEHISAYSLMIEEGTPFYARYHEAEEERADGASRPGAILPDEDTERQMYYMARDLLAEEGYLQYEISNFAKPGFESVHNCGYWTRREYLGFGLGAASQLLNLRFKNTEDLKEYLTGEGNAPAKRMETGLLTWQDAASETMFLGLRMCRGVDLASFERTFSRTVDQAFPGVIDRLCGQGLTEIKDRCLRLTRRGMDVSNYVFSEFI